MPVVALALALAVIVAFAPVVHNEFIILDDETSLYRNPRVQRGFTFEGLRWAFTTVESQNWHPLTWLSHMLDFRLFGAWAGGHHAVSVLLHAANAVLLFALLRSLTGAFWRGILVAAIFGLHPLRVESVAWAAERKDVLSLFFGFLALGAYVRFVRRRGMRDYAVSLAWFACSLMSKAMLVTLPVILLLLDLWPLGRWPRAGRRRLPNAALVLEKLPFLALATGAAIVTYRVQESSGAVGQLVHFPLSGRLGNALTSYGSYLAKTLWPAGLAVLYPYDWQDVPLWQPAVSAAFLATFTLVVFRIRRRRPVYIIGWAWYLVTLLPVIGIVQIGYQSMADRYTYFPQIGALLIVSWGLFDLVPARPWARTATFGVLSVLVAALAVTTWVNVTYWRTNVTLFAHAVAVTRNNPIALGNLGVSLTQAGREAERKELIAKSLQLSPAILRAATFERSGDYYVGKGRLREAAGMYRQALALTPDNTVVTRKLRALGGVDAVPRAAPGPPRQGTAGF